MLGCQDFCGYYDWTFDYMRRRFGSDAVHDLWVSAIAGEAQQHYESAGRKEGLAGLYKCWMKTGRDEQCDWTFMLDEPGNVLRWDMRECPSKGFLLNHHLHAHEDYCDHCMGWMVPLLERLGIGVAVHEHNHAGQCWGEIYVRDKQRVSPPVKDDVRRDPRWGQGFLDRWEEGRKQIPSVTGNNVSGPCDILEAWFAQDTRFIVFATEPRAGLIGSIFEPDTAVLMTDCVYAMIDDPPACRTGVLISEQKPPLEGIACRYHAAPAHQRPLLMYTYLPNPRLLDVTAFDLPRPIPILPLLIRKGIYRHDPQQATPLTGEFLALLAQAFGKPFEVA